MINSSRKSTNSHNLSRKTTHNVCYTNCRLQASLGPENHSTAELTKMK